MKSGVDPVITVRPTTAHGFRAYPAWAEEVATAPNAAIEQAMGHQVGGAVERAYRRTDVLEKRWESMDTWAAYCEPADGSTSLRFGTRAD
jgi:integrase